MLLQVLGIVVIITGIIFVIVSQKYKNKRSIWDTKGVIETSETVEGILCRAIFLPSHHTVTYLSGKFEEVNGRQTLVRVAPYIQIHGLRRALTPTWYHEITTSGYFQLQIPSFTNCEIDIESIDNNLRALKFECDRVEIIKPLGKLFEVGLTIITIGVVVFFTPSTFLLSLFQPS